MGMNRIYSDGVRDDAVYFVAKEVEQTPAYNEKTLFLVGIRPTEEIIKLATEHECTNVYFGTGTSFTPDDVEIPKWDAMIMEVLEAGFWATLDFDVEYAERVHEMTCASHQYFIPMISVKLAYARLFNHNATLKIDDVDFDKTNPGVWCWPMDKLLDSDKFTRWKEYKNDTLIDHES